jgi:hypothetical protein
MLDAKCPIVFSNGNALDIAVVLPHDDNLARTWEHRQQSVVCGVFVRKVTFTDIKALQFAENCGRSLSKTLAQLTSLSFHDRRAAKELPNAIDALKNAIGQRTGRGEDMPFQSQVLKCVVSIDRQTICLLQPTAEMDRMDEELLKCLWRNFNAQYSIAAYIPRYHADAHPATSYFRACIEETSSQLCHSDTCELVARVVAPFFD